MAAFTPASFLVASSLFYPGGFRHFQLLAPCSDTYLIGIKTVSRLLLKGAPRLAWLEYLGAEVDDMTSISNDCADGKLQRQ
jgi:hypothetical protein